MSTGDLQGLPYVGMFYLVAAHFTLLHIATLPLLPKSPHLLTVVESRTEMANAVELCGAVQQLQAMPQKNNTRVPRTPAGSDPHLVCLETTSCSTGRNLNERFVIGS